MQHGNLKRHEVFKDRGSCAIPQNAEDTRDQAKHFPAVGRMLQSITEEVKRQAEKRISSRFIMCVLSHSLFSFEKNPKDADAMENLKNRKKTPKSKRLLGFRAQAQLRSDRGALPQ